MIKVITTLSALKLFIIRLLEARKKIMKYLFSIIILSFLIPNFAYPKLIEFEKCYSAKFLDNKDESVDHDKQKWDQDIFEIRNTILFVHFDERKLDMPINKLNTQPNGKLIDLHWITMSDNWLSKDIIKGFKKDVKTLENLGFRKEQIFEKNIYSINPESGIITHNIILTDAYLKSQEQSDLFFFASERRKGKSNPEKKFVWDKMKVEKFKINSYAGGLLVSEEKVYGNGSQKLTFNLKNNTLMKQVRWGKDSLASTNHFICNRIGSGTSINYLNYWWAVILIAAVIFFIYTQTGRELKIKK